MNKNAPFHGVAPLPAPIALFVYNRPLHTKKTVEALLNNEMASASDLFIFSDNARGEADASAVSEVRQYISTIQGFRSITVFQRSENWGLARSIIDGVTKLCDEFGRAIVLEDDLVSSPHFLTFMNSALDLYADIEEVFHISGSTYPVEINRTIDSYFLRLPLCWGWATWSRAWKQFDKDLKIMDRFDPSMIARFNFDNSYPSFWGQLEANRLGAINTWFIFWYATVFLRNGLVLFPRQSLLQNIGMDGTGVHCDVNDAFAVELSPIAIAVRPIPLEESTEAFGRYRGYFKTLAPSLFSRVRNRIARAVKGRR